MGIKESMQKDITKNYFQVMVGLDDEGKVHAASQINFECIELDDLARVFGTAMAQVRKAVDRAASSGPAYNFPAMVSREMRLALSGDTLICHLQDGLEKPVLTEVNPHDEDSAAQDGHDRN